MTTEQRIIKGFAYFLAGVIILSIVSAILGGISMLAIFDFDERETVSEKQEIDNYSKISNLDIDLNAISLEIKLGDKFSVEKYELKSDVEIKQSGSTLKIDEKDHTWFWNSSDGKIVITVPRDLSLGELKMEVGAGKVNMENITANKLDFEQGAGTAVIENCTFGETEIDGGAGRMEIENSTFTDLDLDCGVGSVVFSGKLLGRSKIAAGVGSIELDIDASKDDYTLDIEKGLGSVKVDGVSTSGKIGNGSNRLTIKGGVGSITVDFRD